MSLPTLRNFKKIEVFVFRKLLSIHVLRKFGQNLPVDKIMVFHLLHTLLTFNLSLKLSFNFQIVVQSTRANKSTRNQSVRDSAMKRLK